MGTSKTFFAFFLFFLAFLFSISSSLSCGASAQSSNSISSNVMYWFSDVPEVKLPTNKAFDLQISAETFCDSANDSACPSFSVTSPSVGLFIFQTNSQFSNSTSTSKDPSQHCSVLDYFSRTPFPRASSFSSSQIKQLIQQVANVSPADIYSSSPAYFILPPPLEYLNLTSGSNRSLQTEGAMAYSLIIDCLVDTDSFFTLLSFNNGTTSSSITLSNPSFVYSPASTFQVIHQSKITSPRS